MIILDPDSFSGRVLILLRSLVELLLFLLLKPSARSLKIARLILGVRLGNYTMVSNAMLIKLYGIVEEVIERNIPGDIVECGTWNGGSAAMMAASCRDSGRTLWLFDSFEGLPSPSPEDEVPPNLSGFLKGDIEKVRKVLSMFAGENEVRIVPGWFEETLVNPPPTEIAVLFIDVDLYKSTKIVLERLYERVVEGGFIIVDDYRRWKGCRKATDEFFKDVQVERIDRCGIYRKPYSS
jgi:O-methyltransferase